ncbi:hypothetical protein A5649_06265 [Mycolicibacter heraklionensis]|uniref:DUF732 domain-containing protein n=1 Tax=Mycolicibacter heraklionensis TaxID=512402 RepID=A0AA91EYK9_9MYCO|nr:DUF732 domain-containing protein [Mycolicibacter heraklionensis]OBK83516.1 hypothetical protein A5649_06265 [Mycolicibacter heraklionensis]
MKVFAGLIVAVGLLLGAAPVAQADRDSFMQYIRDHQINTGYNPEAKTFMTALRICEMLRQGMTAEEFWVGPPFVDARGITDAAQHELCPDTLH